MEPSVIGCVRQPNMSCRLDAPPLVDQSLYLSEVAAAAPPRSPRDYRAVGRVINSDSYRRLAISAPTTTPAAVTTKSAEESRTVRGCNLRYRHTGLIGGLFCSGAIYSI